MYDRSRSWPQQSLFGGHGAVWVRDLAGTPDLPPFRAVLACELEPSGRVGTHLQEQFSELIIFFSGSGWVEIGGDLYEVDAGDVVALPLGQTLAIENRSAQDSLYYLIVKATSEATHQ